MNVVTSFPFVSSGDTWFGRQVFVPFCPIELFSEVDKLPAPLVPILHVPC